MLNTGWYPQRALRRHHPGTLIRFHPNQPVIGKQQLTAPMMMRGEDILRLTQLAFGKEVSRSTGHKNGPILKINDPIKHSGQLPVQGTLSAITAEPVMTTYKASSRSTERTLITGLSLCHLLNDLVQSVLLAIYPLLKADFTLSYTQLGLLSMSYQLTASLMQPLIGGWADRYRLSALLPIGMLSTALCSWWRWYCPPGGPKSAGLPWPPWRRCC